MLLNIVETPASACGSNKRLLGKGPSRVWGRSGAGDREGTWVL